MDLPLDNRISQTSNRQIIDDIIEISYLDGYSQRAKKGLNSQRDRWSLRYFNITKEERDILIQFYRDHGKHTSFSWQAFGDDLKRNWVFLNDYNETNQGKFYSLNFQIEERHEFT